MIKKSALNHQPPKAIELSIAIFAVYLKYGKSLYPKESPNRWIYSRCAGVDREAWHSTVGAFKNGELHLHDEGGDHKNTGIGAILSWE